MPHNTRFELNLHSLDFCIQGMVVKNIRSLDLAGLLSSHLWTCLVSCVWVWTFQPVAPSSALSCPSPVLSTLKFGDLYRVCAMGVPFVILNARMSRCCGPGDTCPNRKDRAGRGLVGMFRASSPVLSLTLWAWE